MGFNSVFKGLMRKTLSRFATCSSSSERNDRMKVWWGRTCRTDSQKGSDIMNWLKTAESSKKYYHRPSLALASFIIIKDITIWWIFKSHSSNKAAYRSPGLPRGFITSYFQVNFQCVLSSNFPFCSSPSHTSWFGHPKHNILQVQAVKPFVV